MSVFDTIRVSMSGLSAQRMRMDVIASNVANVETTRTPDGGPYLRREVVFRTQGTSGVENANFRKVLANTGASIGTGVAVTRISADQGATKAVYDPSHPDADENGNVLFPDIDVVTEMTDMMSATRAYEANVTVLNATKGMALKALSIGR
jgi:flagellar basal-body rod protein FlgC